MKIEKATFHWTGSLDDADGGAENKYLALFAIIRERIAAQFTAN